jgi:hypothetical protein
MSQKQPFLLVSVLHLGAGEPDPYRKGHAAFLGAGGSVAEYGDGLNRAIQLGWLWKLESGTYVKFTEAGADLFA